MALRAGYKGFKKLISPLILNRPGTIEIDGDALNAELNKVFFRRSEQALLGAKNLLINSATTEEKTGVTYTVNEDKTVSLSGTASANQTKYVGAFTAKAGKYYHLTGCPAGGGEGTSDFWLGLYVSGQPVARDTGNGVGFGGLTDQEYQIYIRIPNSKDTTGMIFKPMITYATDPDTTYVPYAETNSELTADITTLKGSAEDQKTSINAIIAAATGAADFAAFKTAMGAITPVTRSAAPAATRKVTEEEPLTVKKSTRKKSTATADTEEKEGDK